MFPHVVGILSFGQKKNVLAWWPRVFMDSPRYTVIVPMAHFCADEPVLASLRETPSPPGGMEILVAEGGHPARQRDCSMGAGYWKELETALVRPEVQVVGGPALLRPHAAPWEEIFHALLTHMLIVGTVSSRYAARGEFRAATQTDLILCNLAVRRSIFEKIGPLSTSLYPNEENEWLDRAHAARVGTYYDPGLQVFRPQRASPGQMARTLLRYGMGRTRQFQVSGWRPSFHQLLPVIVIATAVALIHWRLEREFVLLWLAASAIVAGTCKSLLHVWQRVVAGLIAPLIPLTYTLGQTIGWFALLLPAPILSSEIVLLNERGERIYEKS
jgi:hypothetical protein